MFFRVRNYKKRDCEVMSGIRTKNKKLRGLSMYEVAKGTSVSYPTILKWANGGKVHHVIEKRISKYIEENGK